jgi:hypothetical protein
VGAVINTPHDEDGGERRRLAGDLIEAAILD